MKKNENLLKYMNELDEHYIEEAETLKFSAKRPIWKPLTAIAACAVLTVGIMTAPYLAKGFSEDAEIDNAKTGGDRIFFIGEWDANSGGFLHGGWENGNKTQYYGGGDGGTEIAAENVWDTRPEIGIIPGGAPTTEVTTDTITSMTYVPPYSLTEAYESYHYVYGIRHRNTKVTDEKIGDIQVSFGVSQNPVNGEVYAIKGVDPEYAVIVKHHPIPNEQQNEEHKEVYNLFVNQNAKEIRTFADLINAYSLKEMLYMGEVLAHYDVATKTETYSETGDLSVLKHMIFSLEGTAYSLEEFSNFCLDQTSIGITIVHDSYSVKGGCGLQIFAEGYLMINIDGTIRVFKIDEADANAIIVHAKEMNYNGVSFYNIKSGVKYSESLTEQTSMGYDPNGAVTEPAIETRPAYDPNNRDIPEETSHGLYPNGKTTSDFDGWYVGETTTKNLFTEKTTFASTSHDILPVEPESTISD